MVNKIYFIKQFRAILLCCIFLCGFAMPLQSIDNDNYQDATDLINYIKHRDQYFPWLKQECQSLWSNYVAGKSDMTQVFKNTTDKNLQYLYEYRRQIRDFEQDTHEEIVQLLQEGESLDEVDSSGKRAIDYVTQLPVYHALRNEGAKEKPEFLWVERLLFLDTHKLHIGCGLLATALTGIVCYNYFSSQQQRHAEDKDNPYDAQDEFGRTELMNYLQVQESKIEELSKKVVFIKRCSNLKYDAHGNLIDGSIMISGQSHWDIERQKAQYAQIFREQAPYWKSYQKVLNETKLMIHSMLDKKVNLALTDKQGKSVLNYCYTEELYTILCRAGAPFDYKSYCYFNPGTSCVVIGLCVGAAIGVSSLYKLYEQDNQFLAVGHEFDRFYESKFKDE